MFYVLIMIAESNECTSLNWAETGNSEKVARLKRFSKMTFMSGVINCTDKYDKNHWQSNHGLLATVKCFGRFFFFFKLPQLFLKSIVLLGVITRPLKTDYWSVIKGVFVIRATSFNSFHKPQMMNQGIWTKVFEIKTGKENTVCIFRLRGSAKLVFYVVQQLCTHKNHKINEIVRPWSKPIIKGSWFGSC